MARPIKSTAPQTPAPKYDPPAKPKGYASAASSAEMVRAYQVHPLILDYNPNKFEEEDFLNNFEAFISDEDTVVVGLKSIKGKSIVNFENLYGVQLQQRVYQLNSIRAQEYANWRLNVCEEDVPQEDVRALESLATSVVFLEDENAFTTPYGTMKGSYAKNALEFLSYLFACCGTVSGKEGEAYTTEKVFTTEDFMEIIDMNMFNPQSDTGMTVFEYVLDITNTYKLNKQTEEPATEPEKEVAPKA